MMTARELPPVETLPAHTALRVEDLHITYRARAEVGRQGRSNLLGGHSRTWRKVEALRGVYFEVPFGSVYGVIGHNGAGKSTLFPPVASPSPAGSRPCSPWGWASTGSSPAGRTSSSVASPSGSSPTR